MSKFEEMSFDEKCDVCGKETKVVVCASSMGAISYKYCEHCLNKGLEPYNGMVAYFSLAGKYPDDVNIKYVEYIRAALKELGKTEEEFAEDCNNINSKTNENCSGKRALVIGKIINKTTQQEVCQQYTNRPIRKIIDNIGEELKVTYDNGSFFTHELVVAHEQDDYGYWIETTNKFWRIDN